MAAYYNEIDPDAAAILHALIANNVIAPGDVDQRSIKDVVADDLEGYDQCHFFAGGGLWSVAARLAGWPDDRLLWTGSCPCQPFSQAGQRGGADDPRHLWPDFFRLIRAARPAVVMGEQVAGKAGYGWFDGVAADLGGENYASRAVDIPAAAVGAPHIRQRIYWLADAADPEGRRRLLRRPGESASENHIGTPGQFAGPHGCDVTLADAGGSGRDGWPEDAQRSAEQRDVAERADGGMGDADGAGRPVRQEHLVLGQCETAERTDGSHFWSDAEWTLCHDGKARRSQPGLPLLVDGFPGRVALWRVAGNAISPVLAAEVIRAFIDT